MAYYCFKCRNELEFIVKVGVKVGRLDTCEHCASNLHCCRNCRFYDPNVHNECLETTADFIRDREASNFCSHFEMKNCSEAPEEDTSVASAKSKLDALFGGLK